MAISASGSATRPKYIQFSHNVMGDHYLSKWLWLVIMISRAAHSSHSTCHEDYFFVPISLKRRSFFRSIFFLFSLCIWVGLNKNIKTENSGPIWVLEKYKYWEKIAPEWKGWIKNIKSGKNNADNFWFINGAAVNLSTGRPVSLGKCFCVKLCGGD